MGKRRLVAAGAAVAALAAGAAGAAGCGGQNPAAGVRSALGAFGKAAAQKDYRALCRQILAPSLVEQVESVGMPCETALAQGLGGVSSPTLLVRRVTLHGGRAYAVVHSSAVGQLPSTDTVELVRVAGGWRIAALNAPQQASQTGPQPSPYIDD